VKATEGLHTVDKLFSKHWTDANNASVPAGAYHFMIPGSPEAQADHFIATLQAQGVAGMLPPVLDLERGTSGSPSGSDALVWLARVATALDVTPMVYTGPNFATVDRLASCPDLTQYPLWISHYTDAPAPMACAPWGTDWAVWQYAGQGQVLGIPGRVDRNRAAILPG